MKRFLPLVLLPFSDCTHGETVVLIEIQCGNPIAVALIDDVEVRLIVDSGGFSLGLRPETVAKLNLDESADKTTTTDIHGETQESDAFVIPSVQIGETEFSNLAAYKWQMPPPLASRTPPIDGTLCRDCLNKFVAVYDYGSSTITLYDNSKEGEKACKGVEIPPSSSRCPTASP